MVREKHMAAVLFEKRSVFWVFLVRYQTLNLGQILNSNSSQSSQKDMTVHKRGMTNTSYERHIFVFCFVFCFLGLHPQHMEIPRLGAELEQQPLAYTTATATPDLSHVCDLHQSSRQRQILNPLSEAKDQTCVLMIRFC